MVLVLYLSTHLSCSDIVMCVSTELYIAVVMSCDSLFSKVINGIRTLVLYLSIHLSCADWVMWYYWDIHSCQEEQLFSWHALHAWSANFKLESPVVRHPGCSQDHYIIIFIFIVSNYLYIFFSFLNLWIGIRLVPLREKKGILQQKKKKRKRKQR